MNPQAMAWRLPLRIPTHCYSWLRGVFRSATRRAATSQTRLGLSAGVEHGSLADGRWQLAIPSSNYASTLNGLDLRRLFGEINNDLTVDGTDLLVFGNNFGTHFTPFDWNYDSTIDGSDLTQFGNRFGMII
jgi:hypothetical protein